MKLADELFILIILSISRQLATGKVFFVSDYGAYPDDDLDDTMAIQAAINNAIDDGLKSDIVFGEGVYTISSTISMRNATNLTITGQGMDRTFLIGSNDVVIFSAYFCQSLKLTSFSIDYDPLPFTAGYAVDVNPNLSSDGYFGASI